MRQRAVIGNWKMHGSIQSVRNLMVEIMDGLSPLAGELEVAVCPSFVHLDLVGKLLRGSGSRIKLGAQDAHMKDKGAYTGDVSASMLADLGTSFVLVGHSERRNSAGDTNDIVVSKFGAIQASIEHQFGCADRHRMPVLVRQGRDDAYISRVNGT